MSVSSDPQPMLRPEADRWHKHRAGGQWRASVFAPEGDGVRARLGSDAWKVAVSILGLLVVLRAYRNDARVQQWLVHLTVPPPRGVAWLLTSLALLGTYGATALLVGTSLLARRRPVLIDILGAGLLSFAVVLTLRWALGPTAGVNVAATYPGVDVGIPIPALAAAVAMSLAARPYLARAFQRLCVVGFTLGAVCTVVDGRGLLLSVLASLLIGWGAACAVRLITGVPSGLPGASLVEAMLRELGAPVRSVAPRVRQSWGAARFNAVGLDGATLRVSLYGRDARDAALAASLGRSIAYRDEGTSLFVTRLQQAEHEAYVTLRAHDVLSGAAPVVVAAGCAGASRDGVVLTAPPIGASLRDLLDAKVVVPRAALEGLFRVVASLADRSISHGSIDLEHVIVRDDGSVALDDFVRGTSSASPARSARDVASAITCAALCLGVDRALDLAVASVGTSGVVAALGYFQGPALPPSLATAAKASPELLAQLRDGGAQRAGVEAPELAKLTRVSGATLVIAIGSLIGGWALLAVLLNVANSFSTIKGANLFWVGAVAILAVLCYPMSAMSCEGSIPGWLPYPTLVELELSNTFSGLAAGTVAVMGARIRFFQKQGLDATTAISSGVIVSTVSWIVKGALFLIALPIAWSSFHFSLQNPGGNGHSKAIELVLFVICAAGVALGVVLFVPRVRSVVKKKLAPKATEVRAHLSVLAQHPRKLCQVFGGSIACQLLVAFALGASLHAFNTTLSLAQLLVVLTLGSMLGGMSPVPGGMGVVEAGMILGLVAAGVPEDVAVSAVFVQRLFTAYLPPIAGWFALIGLRRRDLL